MGAVHWNDAAMPHVPATPRTVRFGDIEADLDSGEILRDGRRTLLPDQPLRILLRLLERPGEVVSRDALRREVWSEDTFVDFEHGLNSAIKRLRDVLGDSADAPRYIETVPRRGYRFIGQIDDEAPVPVEAGHAAAAPGWWTRPTNASWVINAVLLATFGVGTLWLAGNTRTSTSDPESLSGIVAHRVLVAALEEDSQGRSLSPVGSLATEHLIAAMSKVDTAEVIPTPVASASADEAAVKALEAGAGLAVLILSHVLGAEQHFEARIQDTRTREMLYFSPRFAAPAERPGEAFEHLSQATAGAVAIHLDHAFGGLRTTSGPPALDAYLTYLAGRELLERDYPRAIEHLQRAARISPDFLLPRLTLVMAYDNRGDQASTRAQMAQIADTAKRFTRAERLLVRYMTESLARRHASALSSLLELEGLVPQSWIVNYGIQQEAIVLNRPQVAIDAFPRLPLDERHGRYNGWRLGMLTRALHLVGEYERELVEARRAQEYEPGNVYYRVDQVRSLAAIGDLDALNRVIDDSLSTPPTAGDPLAVIQQAARELRAHERRSAAVAVANRGIEWLTSRAPSVSATEAHRAQLARLLYLAERGEEAVAELERLIRERPSSIEYAGQLGAISAVRGNRERALEYDSRLHQLSGSDLHGRHTYWRACIASLLGESDRAVALLLDAFREGHFRGLEIHQSHEFEPLREFPPFVELATPRP